MLTCGVELHAQVCANFLEKAGELPSTLHCQKEYCNCQPRIRVDMLNLYFPVAGWCEKDTEEFNNK
jgi:hypothetical protein